MLFWSSYLFSTHWSHLFPLFCFSSCWWCSASKASILFRRWETWKGVCFNISRILTLFGEHQVELYWYDNAMAVSLLLSPFLSKMCPANVYNQMLLIDHFILCFTWIWCFKPFPITRLLSSVVCQDLCFSVNIIGLHRYYQNSGIICNNCTTFSGLDMHRLHLIISFFQPLTPFVSGNDKPSPDLIDLLVESNTYDMAFMVILKFWKGSGLKRLYSALKLLP